jgi:hypothetical protein
MLEYERLEGDMPMARFFQDAHDRFEENLATLGEKEDRDREDELIWNLSVGLRNLTDALKAEHESIQRTLAEITRDLQRRR